MIRKYIPDPSHIIKYELMEINKDLSYVEEPTQIVDKKESGHPSGSSNLETSFWRGNNQGARGENEKGLSPPFHR